MRRPPARDWIGAALLAAALLAGCAGGDTPGTRFYVLSALPEGTAAVDGARRDPPLALDIAPVRLPQYLARPQIVTRTAGNEIALEEYHQWGGNLAKNMMRVLARNLSRLLATPEITLFSRRPPAPADARLEIEVLEFERGPDRRVRLSAQWRLRAGDDGAPALARISERASAPLPPEAGMQATVSAMSDLLADLSVEVANAVVALERGG